MPPKSRHGNRGKVIKDEKSDMDTRGRGCSDDHVLAQVEVDETLPSKIDYVALLPKEVVLFVLGYLEPSDLLKAAQTSKIWRKVAEDDLLWKNKSEKAGLPYRLNSQNTETLQRLSKKTAFIYSVWKASFLKPYRIEKNFRTKNPEVTKVEKCHFIEGDYLRLSVLNNRIVSSSSSAMYIACALTGKTLQTLVGHTGPVKAIQMNNDFVISGSWDKSVRVWDINTGECVHVLQGHTGPVICLHLHGGIVVSGSQDTTLRMWDVRGGQFLKMLMGHSRGVNCVQYTGNLVVSSSDDRRVRVWDPETGECLRTLSGHTSGIRSLKVDGVHVVSGDWNTIKIWEVTTGVLRDTMYNYWGNNFGVQDNVLVGFNRLERKCKIWNILTSSCLQTLDNDTITSFQFNNKFVVTGQSDGMVSLYVDAPPSIKVKLWDVKTGEFIRDVFRLESGGKVVKILLEETKIVCAIQLLRMDNLKKLDIVVLNLDLNDFKQEHFISNNRQ